MFSFLILVYATYASLKEDKFNHQIDRHETAMWTTYLPDYVYIRPGLYECVNQLEKELGRAPYNIEIVLKYLKEKAWWKLPRGFYISLLADMYKDDIFYTSPTMD